MAENALARAASSAKLTGELHAQARQNGRVLDDFWISTVL
jgi:hypothetical protein